MKKKAQSKKGVALVTTLLIIALLITVIVEFNRNAIANIELSRNFSDEKRILFLSASGVNAVRELLSFDARFSKSDDLLEDWAKGPTLFETANAAIEEGRIDGRITDEDGKMNVNSLVGDKGEFNEQQRALFKRLLGQRRFRLTDQQIDTILFGIKDWVDRDHDVSGLYGAEDPFYDNRGYRCKNSPMGNIEEMLLVRGMTRDILYGTAFRPGILPFLTVCGGGKININTAPVPVLMALSEQMTEEIADEMNQFRLDKTNRNQLKNPDWYKALWPFEEPLPENIMKTDSDYFTLDIKGSMGESVKQIRVLIHRSKGETSILSWWEM